MTQSTIESTIIQTEGQPERNLTKILHVDDEIGFLKISTKILRNMGNFEVDTATSARARSMFEYRFKLSGLRHNLVPFLEKIHKMTLKSKFKAILHHTSNYRSNLPPTTIL